MNLYYQVHKWTYTEELWQQSWSAKFNSLILNKDIFVVLQ